MSVPGASLMSEQECSKVLKEPIINQKGKYVGKQAKNKKGKLLWSYKAVPDLSKYDKHVVKVDSPKQRGKTELITYYTRKNREIRQSINMSQEAYAYFVSNEVPQGFKASGNFKFKKKGKEVSVNVAAWQMLSIEQKLNWHLQTICESLGGRMISYSVFND